MIFRCDVVLLNKLKQTKMNETTLPLIMAHNAQSTSGKKKGGFVNLAASYVSPGKNSMSPFILNHAMTMSEMFKEGVDIFDFDTFPTDGKFIGELSTIVKNKCLMNILELLMKCFCICCKKRPDINIKDDVVFAHTSPALGWRYCSDVLLEFSETLHKYKYKRNDSILLSFNAGGGPTPNTVVWEDLLKFERTIKNLMISIFPASQLRVYKFEEFVEQRRNDNDQKICWIVNGISKYNEEIPPTPVEKYGINLYVKNLLSSSFYKSRNKIEKFNRSDAFENRSRNGVVVLCCDHLLQNDVAIMKRKCIFKI
jgi:hypothetical protein